MPITVSHQPDFGIVGGASYGVGQGRNRRYEDELARQEAARMRQERLQQAELAQRAKSAQQNFQMQQAELALRAQNQDFNQNFQLNKAETELDMFNAETRNKFDLQENAFNDRMEEERRRNEYNQQQWIVGQEATAAQEAEKHHDNMEKTMFAKGFEYSPEDESKLNKLQVARGKLLSDRTMSPQEYAQGILSISKEQALILPSVKKKPDVPFQEKFSSESFFDENMGGTWFNTPNGPQFHKQEKDTKKEDNLQKALSVASKDYSDHLKRIANMEEAKGKMIDDLSSGENATMEVGAARQRASEVYDPQIQALSGSLGYFQDAMNKAQTNIQFGMSNEQLGQRSYQESINPQNQLPTLTGQDALNAARSRQQQVGAQGGAPVQGPAQAAPQQVDQRQSEMKMKVEQKIPEALAAGPAQTKYILEVIGSNQSGLNPKDALALWMNAMQQAKARYPDQFKNY
jgi:hypothetical protein